MRVVKIIFGSFCAIITAAGIYNTVLEPSVYNLLLTVAFAVLTWWLLIRKPGKKQKSKPAPATMVTFEPASASRVMPEPTPVTKVTPVPIPIPQPAIKKTVNRGIAMSQQMELDCHTAKSIQQRLIAFDVETTGFNRVSDRIVEIGAVLFSDGKPERTFSSLVNPGIPMPPAAAKVNHITDEMLAAAPSEEEIYPKLIDFLGDALQGKTLMCAHNASFDFDFLCNTLSRLGYNANIHYVDTLPIAREYLPQLPNHKQGTLEAHFGLTNAASHRAGSDAANCGHILLRLLDTAKEALEAEWQMVETVKPSEEELEVCAYVQQLIADKGGDTALLRYRKTSTGHVDMCCLYVFLRMKFSKKGRYILAKKEWALPEGFRTEPCVQSEGGTIFIRVYFANPFDLAPLSDNIYQAYVAMRSAMENYASRSSHTRKEAEKSFRMMFPLTDDEAAAILKAASEHDYAPVPPSDACKAEEKARVKAEKAKQKAERAAQKTERAAESKQPTGRAMLQMDDNGNVIKEFETVSSAAIATGISPKSIRDAAKGVQKHAGGFRWAYKE